MVLHGEPLYLFNFLDFANTKLRGVSGISPRVNYGVRTRLGKRLVRQNDCAGEGALDKKGCVELKSLTA